MHLPRIIRNRRLAASLALVAAGAGLTVVSSAPQAVAATCGASTSGAFTPARAVISGIGTKTMVPVGTSGGALATPSRSNAGLQQVGWYRGGYLPGQGYSVALDAHSYFKTNGRTLMAADRPYALGNALLLGFRAGSTITVYNASGSKHICYRFASRTAYSTSPTSARTMMNRAVLTQREQVAIIVCSGTRTNGSYNQRTMFVAVR
ncbi:MAG TPA: class F sortase [Marmoricola sp.]|nr:class F sortase [Marmoricola sp.]